MKTFVMFVCVFVVCLSTAAAAPTITIDPLSVPAWGYVANVGGVATYTIDAVVTGVDVAQYDVYVSLAIQGGGFYSKPGVVAGVATPATLISGTNRYRCSFPVAGNPNALPPWGNQTDRIATDFVAVLYKKDKGPIPANDDARGIRDYGYAAIGYYERFGTTINLGGRNFGVKSSVCPDRLWVPGIGQLAGFDVPVGPNSNYFYPGPDVVVQDINTGYIDLTFKGNVGKPLCAELVALEHLGYGTYKSVVNVGNIPAGVTVSPGYLFDVFGDLASNNTNREIDAELGDVAVKNGGTAQFVMQSNDPKVFTKEPYNITTTGRIQTTISWRPERIDFLMENLDTHESRTWGYTGDYLPTDPGQAQFRINAWVSDKSIWIPNPNAGPIAEVQSFNYAAGDNGTMVIAAGEVEILNKISGTGDLIVNGSLTAGSIVQNSLTIGAGGSVIISEAAATAVPEPSTVAYMCGLFLFYAMLYLVGVSVVYLYKTFLRRSK